jgi:hypothetical protein
MSVESVSDREPGLCETLGVGCGFLAALDAEGSMLERDEVLGALAGSTDLLRRHKVRSLSLFGSIARNEATPKSDVDLIVEFSEPVGLFAFVRLKRDLDGLLGRRVDLVTPDAIRERLRDVIMSEAIRAA